MTTVHCSCLWARITSQLLPSSVHSSTAGGKAVRVGGRERQGKIVVVVEVGIPGRKDGGREVGICDRCEQHIRGRSTSGSGFMHA